MGYVVLSKSVFLEPNKMKVDDLREAVEKRGIVCSTRTKKPIADALKKWIDIASQQKAEGTKAHELNTLKLNKKISGPVSLAVAGDAHIHSVLQVALENNGAFLRGQDLCTIAIPESLPYAISVFKSSLIVAHASSRGGRWKRNLQTQQQKLPLANGTVPRSNVHMVLPPIKRKSTLQTEKRQGISNCCLWPRGKCRWDLQKCYIFTANGNLC